MSPSLPPDPHDSVPPLSAGATGVTAIRSAHGRRLLGGIAALALAFGSAAAVRAHAASLVEERPRAPPQPDTGAPLAAPPPLPVPEDDDAEPDTLDAQRRRLFGRMEQELGVSGEAMARVQAIFAASPVLGQGNPAIARHPMKRSECRRIRAEAGLVGARVAACGAPNMVPLFDAEAGQTAADAPVCIDQLEYPDIPCEYPVVNVRAREAALLCEAVGQAPLRRARVGGRVRRLAAAADGGVPLGLAARSGDLRAQRPAREGVGVRADQGPRALRHGEHPHAAGARAAGGRRARRTPTRPARSRCASRASGSSISTATRRST